MNCYQLNAHTRTYRNSSIFYLNVRAIRKKNKIQKKNLFINQICYGVTFSFGPFVYFSCYRAEDVMRIKKNTRTAKNAIDRIIEYKSLLNGWCFFLRRNASDHYAQFDCRLCFNNKPSYKHSIHSNNNNNKPYNNKKKQAISKSGICKFVCVCVVVQERHIERKLVTIVKRYVKCLMVDTTGVCVCLYAKCFQTHINWSAQKSEMEKWIRARLILTKQRVLYMYMIKCN